jgi:subfamily B ATP-binding cassette protein MsbA
MYILRSIMSPITQLGSVPTNIQGVLSASERICDLFDTQSEILDGTHAISAFRQSIQLQQVSFSYGKTPVLHAVDLEIKKGEVVALVGPSGAGKSTAVDLIMRFYDPQQGKILIDGRDLRELQQGSYRRLFGVVSQESLLFNASIRDNIAYGRDGLTDEQIVQAARIANAADFIEQSPEKFKTFVGDRGVRLSGGQRQRIAIARAVVANPDVLILDEATSALDSESERLVQEAIERVIEHTTAIIIAHRLSTIMHADKIVVFDHGQIVDVGKHEELIDRCGLYKHLCSLQFGQKVDPAVGTTSCLT